MRISQRDYSSKPVLSDAASFYSNYRSIGDVCYPEFLQFFTNLRYLVGFKYKSFSEFSRLIYASYHITVSNARVAGYEKGYYKVASYNWLKTISLFLGVDVHEMMTISFRERDARIAERK